MTRFCSFVLLVASVQTTVLFLVILAGNFGIGPGERVLVVLFPGGRMRLGVSGAILLTYTFSIPSFLYLLGHK